MPKIVIKILSISVISILVLSFVMSTSIFNGAINAAPYVANRSLKINSSEAGSLGVQYEFAFNIPNISNLGAIKLLLCSNSPLPDEACNGFSGNGLSTTSSAIVTGLGGFTIDSGTPPSQTEVLLTRSLQAASASSVAITLLDVTNPGAIGTYYGKILLYDNINASGNPIYFGGLAFSINRQIDVTTEVPPYLSFCVAIKINGYDCAYIEDSYYNFGELSTTHTSVAQTQFSTATNSGSGYSVTYHGNTMTSGNNLIDPTGLLSTNNVGQGQFGMNLRHNTNPQIGEELVGVGPFPTTNPSYGQINRFSYLSGDVLVSINEPSYFTKYSIAYIVNIGPNQPAGYYSTSVMFIALANF